MTTATFIPAQAPKRKSKAARLLKFYGIVVGATIVALPIPHIYTNVAATVSLAQDISSTTAAVEEFIAEHPDATDISVVSPSAREGNMIVHFGTADNYTICGMNAFGSPDWIRYTSDDDRTATGNGSDNGLCAIPDQKIGKTFGWVQTASY